MKNADNDNAKQGVPEKARPAFCRLFFSRRGLFVGGDDVVERADLDLDVLLAALLGDFFTQRIDLRPDRADVLRRLLRLGKERGEEAVGLALLLFTFSPFTASVSFAMRA